MKWRWWKTAQEIRDEVLEAIEEKKQQEEAKKDEEPWVDIKGAVQDPEHGIKMELDWNDAFVEFLRDAGIQGTDDEVIVQKWITLLYRDLIEQNSEQTSGEQFE